MYKVPFVIKVTGIHQSIMKMPMSIKGRLVQIDHLVN